MNKKQLNIIIKALELETQTLEEKEQIDKYNYAK